jgi:hypothetical protein
VKAEKHGRKSNDVGSESAKLPLHDSDSAGSGIAKPSKGTSYLRAVLARLLIPQFLPFAGSDNSTPLPSHHKLNLREQTSESAQDARRRPNQPLHLHHQDRTRVPPSKQRPLRSTIPIYPCSTARIFSLPINSDFPHAELTLHSKMVHQANTSTPATTPIRNNNSIPVQWLNRLKIQTILPILVTQRYLFPLLPRSLTLSRAI